MLPGTQPASYRWSNHVNCCPDTYRPVAVEDRGDTIVAGVLGLDQEVEAMVALRIFQYPVAPKGSTPARYSLNN